MFRGTSILGTADEGGSVQSISSPTGLLVSLGGSVLWRCQPNLSCLPLRIAVPKITQRSKSFWGAKPPQKLGWTERGRDGDAAGLYGFLGHRGFVWVVFAPWWQVRPSGRSDLFGLRPLLSVDNMAAPCPSRAAAVKDGALAPPKACPCRVGRGVATPTPHRTGCADFQLPVLHGRASLTVL